MIIKRNGDTGVVPNDLDDLAQHLFLCFRIMEEENGDLYRSNRDYGADSH